MIEIIASIVAGICTIIISLNPILKSLRKMAKCNTVQSELVNEALLGILRNNITNIYYKYIHSDSLPSHIKENLTRQYTIYSKMNGNSYVDIIYKELLEIPTE